MNDTPNCDPVFKDRAELEAWVKERARLAGVTLAGRMEALEHIRRVTLAHVHLGEG